MIERVLTWGVAIFLYWLAFRLLKNDKLKSFWTTLILATIVLFSAQSWFQGLIKTEIVSVVFTTLQRYGEKLDDFQKTTGKMQTELSDHQKRIDGHQQELTLQQSSILGVQCDITNQQKNITEQQSLVGELLTNITNQHQRLFVAENELASAQTNLLAQQKQIEDVQYLVKNLFLQVTNETFFGGDTNHVFFKEVGTVQRVFFKLNKVPIRNSIHGMFKTDANQGSLFPAFWQYQNVIEVNFTEGRDALEKSTFTFEYVKDTRETNIIQNIEIRESNLYFDNKIRVGLTEKGIAIYY